MDKNNQDTGEFVFVQEKIKSKRKRHIKKVVFLTTLTLFLAAVFGVTARIIFVSSEGFVNKLLGIEESDINIKDSQILERSQITFPLSADSLKTESNYSEEPKEENQKNDVTMSPSLPTPTPIEEEVSPTSLSADVTPTLIPITSQALVSPASTEGANSDSISGSEVTEAEANVPADGTHTAPEIKEEGIKENNEAAEEEQNKGSESHRAQLAADMLKPTPSLLDTYVATMSELRRLADKTRKSILNITAITNGVNWMDENIELSEEVSGVAMCDNKVELLILTRYDKIMNADRLEIHFGNDSVEAELFSFDSDYNVAVIAVPLLSIPKTETAKINYIGLGDSDRVSEGIPIIALGSPNGYAGSIEYGFVTSIGTEAYVVDGAVTLFTTDISSNDINDGIIVNLSGELIGLITHTIGDAATNGVNTAVCINSLKKLALNLLNGVDRPYFGVHAEDMPKTVLSEMEIENGIYVNEVEEDSPAYAAGLKKGDIIIKFNDSKIDNVRYFTNVLSNTEFETPVAVSIYRGSQRDAHITELSAMVIKKLK